MSSLSASDRQYLESILEMSDGYVLDYTNDTFKALFRRHGVDAWYLTATPCGPALGVCGPSRRGRQDV